MSSYNNDVAQAAAMRILQSHIAAQLAEKPNLCGCGNSIARIMENAQTADLYAAWEPRHISIEAALDARFTLLQGEHIIVDDKVFRLSMKECKSGKFVYIGPRCEFDRVQFKDLKPTALNIYNSALELIGEDEVWREGEGGVDEYFNGEEFDKMRDSTLSAARWPFAIRTATISSEVDPHVVGVGYKGKPHVLPTDCRAGELGVIETSEPCTLGFGRAWCEADELTITYTADIKDTATFPPDFVEALTLRLAIRLAYLIRKDKGKPFRDVLEARYRDIIERRRRS